MRIYVSVLIISFVFLFLPVGDADAHDIWLQPEQFTLSKGDTLIVHQLVGHELVSELELPLLRHLTPRFELVSTNGSVNLLNDLPNAEVNPVLNKKLDREGISLLTMEHDFFYDEFPNETFLKYLKYEELINKYGDQLAKTPKQSERYARTMKSLVKVGKVTNGDIYKKVLGKKAEIVVLNNPYLLKPGEDLKVQVLFDGKPLPNQLVMAINGDGKTSGTTLKARTTSDGIANFKLNQKGTWLIRLVYLRPCPDPYTDWESFWASYTFELD